MRTTYILLVLGLLVISILPTVIANDAGEGIGISVETERFTPRLWMCDHRAVIDDDLEEGRVDGDHIYSAKVETCEVSWEACVTSCVQEAESECHQENDGPIDCSEQDSDALSCVTACVEATFKVTGDPDDDITAAEIREDLVELFGDHDFIDDQAFQRLLAKLLRFKDSCRILKGHELKERLQNYAFEGEKIEWIVLAMDKNKIEEITDVVATVGSTQGVGNRIEVECVRLNGFAAPGETINDACAARIDEEELKQFDDQTMAFYECTLTVEPSNSMYGEHWVTVEACDASGLCATMDENEFWFFNPVIALDISSTQLNFGVVRPGTISYAQTITVGNDADVGSGVLLDMFISGTDFYDPSSSGARCVITNRLKLGNNFVSTTNNRGRNTPNHECRIGFMDTDDHLCYFASNGAYSTGSGPLGPDPRADAEGYVSVVYGDNFDTDFYNDAEIIHDGGAGFLGPYSPGNVLAPGAEIAITFKLGLPEPCVGDFTDGDIFFWGEAI